MNGTLHSLLPDLLVVLWENASDHKCYQSVGFTERKRLQKKKHKPELASLDGLLCVCFDLSEFGTPRTCKKKKENNGLKKKDTWT